MTLKERAKRSKNALIVFSIYQNWLTNRRSKSGNSSSALGSTHSQKSLAESLAYINRQFDDYLFHLAIGASDLHGKRVLEIGFGDNIGVALKFIAAGASFVACIDKFYAGRDRGKEREIYSALRDNLDEPSKARFDEAISLTDELPINSARIECLYGLSVEEADELTRQKPFDLAVSRAVLQQIYEPDQTLAAMDRLLAPGGFMLHKVDLSDQGVFRDHGMHPLTFLTIPEWVYRAMAEGSGRSNRKLVSYYTRKLKQMGYDVKVIVTDVIGRKGKGDLYPPVEPAQLTSAHLADALPLVQGIRKRLAPEFRELPDQELAIDGVFLVAKKPST